MSVMHGTAAGNAGESAAPPERARGLAGSIIKARYRVSAISSVSRDVVCYAAEELRYGRPITLKVLRDAVADDPEFVAAVRDQASTLAIAAHVHRGVPRVYECGTTDTGDLFIALERTKGVTLREVLDARGPLDPSTALRIASQVGEALETLHHNRIVHGQLGPESIVLVKDDDGVEHAMLVDVELTAAHRTMLGRRRREASPPAYPAPEQIEADETAEATDQYALGMLLRELVTAGSSDTIEHTGSTPPDVTRIITTALEARPERRYPDISVMVNDMWGAQTARAEPAPRPRFVEARAHTRRRRRPRRPEVTLRIAAAVATAGIIAAVVWFALSGAIVSRMRAVPTAPAATAVPAVQDATLAHPSAAPRPTPVVERQEPGTAVPVVDRAPQRPVEARTAAERPATPGRAATDGGDGSAIIDWLLNGRR